MQLHRAREMSEDGDSAVLLCGGHARQEPGGARVDGGADAHQGQEVLQRLQEEDGGRHGHLLRRSVSCSCKRPFHPNIYLILLWGTSIQGDHSGCLKPPVYFNFITRHVNSGGYFVS